MSGDLARRLRARWQDGGARGLLSAMAGRLGAVTPVLLLEATPDAADVEETPAALTFTWATAEEFDRWLAVPAFQFPARLALQGRNWLRRGDQCLVGLLDGQPATYLWVGTSVREFPGTPCVIGPGTAYVYKTFTLASLRGRGLNTAALHEVRRRSVQAGHRRLLIDVAADNAASLRAIERAGFVRAARFFIVRLGGRRRAWLPPQVRRYISGT
ncbi:MAG TPA: GNAT family N-acetyltransferase [Luteitalea sp.]|nr:GNAT family N-acetyltransferase [Luteitalea sp.]